MTAKIVDLDEYDLQEVAMRAALVVVVREVLPSARETIYTASSFEGQYIGQLGEKAVEKYFHLPAHRLIAPGGDGGVDATINKWKCQVRTRNYRGPGLKLIFKEIFTADVAILARVVTPAQVELVGCITRTRFAKVAQRENFGNGDDYACSIGDLADIETLLTEDRDSYVRRPAIETSPT